MSAPNLPLVIEPEQLKSALEQDELLLVDLSQPATYVQYHLPDAVFLDYSWIVHSEPPRMGLLPQKEQLSHVLGALGMSPDTHVVTYDDEGGGRACRFLWTLDAIGHKNHSLLNGGLQGWANAGFEVSSKIRYPTPGEDYPVSFNDEPVATQQYILDHLNDDKVALLDCRSSKEYQGTKVLAARGGHIPGAKNIDWVEAMDRQHDLRLKPESALREMLESQSITQDKTIVTYCQGHHRSAHTYIMLKSLGYEKVKGYPGSWSDWGNNANTPIEI